MLFTLWSVTPKKNSPSFQEGRSTQKKKITYVLLGCFYIYTYFYNPFSNNFFHIEKCLFLIISIPRNTQSKLQKVKYSEAIV